GTRADPDGGTPPRWLELIDSRDRAGAIHEVERGIELRRAFRFDHRCRWPDGSTHWLEVLGEPQFAGDVLVGAQGLVWNVDERYRLLDERARLLDLEHYGRLRAEYLARVHDVFSRAVDVQEIMEQVTKAAVPDLADWCSAVLVVDQPVDAPLIVAAHKDSHMREWANDVLTKFPYDPNAPFGSAKVIRTGEREIRENLSSLLATVAPTQREVLETADIDSIVTLPVVGQLGLLGSLQMIRGRNRAAFSAADVELAEELASRCGAALDSAVLLARQRTSTEALETLQRVSGWLARAVTRDDVAVATVTHGAEGLKANGGVVFALGDDGELVALARAGELSTAGTASDTWLLDAVRRAIDADQQLVDESTVHGGARTALVTPLRILNRLSGATVFVFDHQRRFADAEFGMTLTLASRCAGALERASYYERERDTALVLQRRLLPQVPQVPCWAEVGFRYEPASGGQVGGDWFQLINIDDDELVAVVGDAVGHGITAAAAMGQLRSSIATAVSFDRDPAAVLRNVDRFACSIAETLAATAVVTLIERDGTCRLASAGHVPPVLVHAGGKSSVLEEGRRPLLGFGDGVLRSPSYTTVLAAGDLIVLYSDGLVERRGELIDTGIDRLRTLLGLLHHLPLQQLCDELVDRLGRDGGTGGGTDDDIALLLLRYVGAP
ncbi:MAG: hypothetical protein RJA49_1555, partial [Actinomycetota bacterium]